ncbi:DUF3617 domain-containing protein [Tsuneonella amylolytica]|uniref:DUF3617 domain-containing protein n=1 Tax=Tsuneonella amylolytica TaxID=2338327 RepID=UPI0013C4ADA8|nr:DUF3617 domain-containing protein [Tsuneonella amylolytica]
MSKPLAAVAAVLAPLFVLAACGSESEPRTAEEVVAEAGKLEKPRPGQYETQVELLEFSVPGLPPKQAEQLRSMMGNVQEKASSYCLTQAEADKGFEDSIRKMTEGTGGMKCEFDKFDAGGGKLDAALSCTGGQGLNSTITIDGTTGAEASTMNVRMAQKAPMIPGGEVVMRMRMDSKRTGDCPA